MSQIPYLDHEIWFPPTSEALDEPNGLLAAGGDLSPERILEAYKRGIFPWYEEGQPILWWSPAPRTALRPDDIHISRSLRKTLKRKPYRISMDEAFEEVIAACAAPRAYAEDTWITVEMEEAYCELHQQGYAHSVECWNGDTLAGGLYGIAIGKVFFGESMFSRADNASKIALVHLCGQLREWGYRLIDCQMHTDHLASLGATELSRTQFERELPSKNPPSPTGNPVPWVLSWGYI
ncbi:MAG: leucyl/phenylalanyl-tRNA--protein transferase [Cellvibrionaceae bacterium]